MSSKHPKIDTPCIGICSTVYGDDICRGCKRYYDEIIDWNVFEKPQREAINERLERNLIKVMQCFIVISDPVLLEDKLQKYQIRYSQAQSAYSWAYHLLRVGADKMQDIENYGIKLHNACSNLSLRQLFDQIDDALYQYACHENLTCRGERCSPSHPPE